MEYASQNPKPRPRALLVDRIRRVEVDGPLDEPLPHRSDVEVDVRLGRAGDRRDVVKARDGA
jgi:hypothetical protein